MNNAEESDKSLEKMITQSVLALAKDASSLGIMQTKTPDSRK